MKQKRSWETKYNASINYKKKILFVNTFTKKKYAFLILMMYFVAKFKHYASFFYKETLILFVDNTGFVTSNEELLNL